MRFEQPLDTAAVARMAAFVGTGLRTGALRLTVDRVFGIDDVFEAHRYLENGAHTGKIVVSV